MLLSLALAAVLCFRCKALASALPDLYTACSEVILASVPPCVLVEQTLLRTQRGGRSLIDTGSTCVLGPGGLVSYEILYFDETETV